MENIFKIHDKIRRIVKRKRPKSFICVDFWVEYGDINKTTNSIKCKLNTKNTKKIKEFFKRTQELILEHAKQKNKTIKIPL